MQKPFELFIPGKPQGKQRPRKGRYGFYTPKATKAYERTVALLAKAEMAKSCRRITEKPISLSLRILYEIPKSWPKHKQLSAAEQRIKPTVKPDADNVQKIILDALNGVFYFDDKQCVKIVAVEKLYAKEPGVYLSINII